MHFDCKSGVAREENGSIVGCNLGSYEGKLACAGTAPYQMARNDNVTEPVPQYRFSHTRVTEPVHSTGSLTLSFLAI